MPYTAAAINMMIASPSDVEAEHGAIRRAIEDWNAAHSFDRKIVLVPINWRTHSWPEMGDRPQGIINKQLLEKCDLLVAVFWTRIGTNTGEAEGGTVEEIEKHLAAGKPAMIYFSEANISPASVDNTQYQAVMAFKEKIGKRGLTWTYKTVQEFSDMFGRHLAQRIVEDFGNLNAAASTDSSKEQKGSFGNPPILS